ncbi:MAG: sensor histidine kinase [Janthinobacterium lividum]|jgi:two-component system LytT family sensor kinase
MPDQPISATLGQRLVASPVGRVAVPLVLWGLYITYHYLNTIRFLGEDGLNTPLLQWGFTLKEALAAVLGYYFFSWVVLPRWLLRRRWLLTVAGLVAIYYTWALLSYGLFVVADHYGAIHRVGTNNYFYRILDKGLWTGVFAWHGVSIGLVDFSFAVMPPLMVRFVQFLLVSANRSLRLQRENLNLEINFLKAQVNPHFLFNTLNNLYTLVVKQDERAPVMVQHLTDLMHYTVYESTAPLAPLSQEIAFIEAYLELERLRYGKKVRINYELTGDLTSLSLTPLLFFPFVENAFKHGIDSSLDASWVEIVLAVRGQWLHFSVRNSYSPGAPQREVGGVGLANVRKRLALHYPATDYTLDIRQNAAEYEVLLTLYLTPTAPATPLPAPALASYA